jgi:hypothetical protein
LFGSKRIISQLIEAQRLERESWAEERRTLLNRIQAPQVAAYEATGEPSDVPLYVPYDDDDAHADYVEARRAGEVI